MHLFENKKYPGYFIFKPTEIYKAAGCFRPFTACHAGLWKALWWQVQPGYVCRPQSSAVFEESTSKSVVSGFKRQGAVSELAFGEVSWGGAPLRRLFFFWKTQYYGLLSGVNC